MAGLLAKGRVLFYDLPSLRLLRPPAQDCPACGARWPELALRVITPELADQWGLDRQWTARFDEREGVLCLGCRCSRRSRHLADSVVGLSHRQWGTRSASLASLVREPRFAMLQVAEVNSCGALHAQLRRAPHLAFSEYGSTDPQVPSQDLQDLGYRDDSFDLVLTSDTLEHVPDPRRALEEVLRVLKPGGWHAFTVPVVDDARTTRRRAVLVDGGVSLLLPASYHGRPGQRDPDLLVFHEFGMDLIDVVRGVGYDVQVVQDEANPALITILAQKPEGSATNA